MLARATKRTMVVLALAAGSVIATSGMALADPPSGPATGPQGQFLCPAVGDGVANADAHNGDNGVSSFEIASGQSFLPGNNQAGAHAPNQALNTEGPGDSAGPGGGNSNWSPIWPGTALD